MCLQELRRWATQVRAEIVTSNVQPGRFIVVDGKLTLHIRARQPNGQLLGIMVDDQRDPKERGTIFAERGDLLSNERGIFLLLANGAVHRHEAGKQDPVIVRFQDYAFDLSRLVAERRPGDVRHPRTIDPRTAQSARPTIRCTSDRPGTSAPSCTIESRCRSIRWRSCS